jgi:hypothetical protein
MADYLSGHTDMRVHIWIACMSLLYPRIIGRVGIEDGA